MKRILTTILIIFLSTISYPQTIQFGIFSSGTDLLVKVKPSANYTTSDFLTDLVLTIRWSTSYGVSLGSSSSNYSIIETGSEGTISSFSYQKFILSGGTPITLPENWTSGSQYTILTVPVNQTGSGTGTFELAPNSFISGGDAYIEINLSPEVNTTNPFYQSSIANIPLPVELSAFCASLSQNNVCLNWKTATEVNNNGFEVQRKSDAPNSDWTKVGFLEGNGNSNSPKDYTYVDKNLTSGTKFIYRLKQIDNDGKFQYSKEVEVEVVPKQYTLYQNYPNPFNPTTTIKFDLPQATEVNLTVYNILGEKVLTLINGMQEAGYHSVMFNASNLASGTYIYRLQSHNFVQTKKMLLVK